MPRESRRVLAAVLGVALLLVVLDALRRAERLAVPAAVFDVERDRSLIEVVGFGVTGAAAVLLLREARRRAPAPVLRLWAAVLGLVLLDDALELHESVSKALGSAVALPRVPTLRSQEVGELGLWLVVGVLVAVPLLAAYRASGPAARRTSLLLLLPTAALGASAVGLDLLAISVQTLLPGRATVGVGLVEAAAELTSLGGYLAVAVRPAARDVVG